MTATVITHSDRFTAAAFHEGVSDFVYHLFTGSGDAVFRKHKADQGALGPPYEEEYLATAVRESPIYHVRNVTTPTLIESGEHALHEHGTLLANGLHYFGIPYEYYLYPRTGHVTFEPQLVQDELRRKLDWFGYWIQDRPYSDPEKQAKYDEWKARRNG
jgi:dipeptidyl aminopeptidase/acylaminoacyl peptidase